MFYVSVCLSSPGMDYMYVARDRLMQPESLFHPHPLSEVSVHVVRDHILNQYRTVIHPEADQELLMGVFSSFNEGVPAPMREDSWPSDYDDERAPPVGTSLEVLWHVSGAHACCPMCRHVTDTNVDRAGHCR